MRAVSSHRVANALKPRSGVAWGSGGDDRCARPAHGTRAGITPRSSRTAAVTARIDASKYDWACSGAMTTSARCTGRSKRPPPGASRVSMQPDDRARGFLVAAPATSRVELGFGMAGRSCSAQRSANAAQHPSPVATQDAAGVASWSPSPPRDPVATDGEGGSHLCDDLHRNRSPAGE